MKSIRNVFIGLVLSVGLVGYSQTVKVVPLDPVDA